MRQQLEGHVAAETQVLSLVDFPHSAFAQLPENAIVTDRLADHRSVPRVNKAVPV
jgi:hypothetical protein